MCFTIACLMATGLLTLTGVQKMAAGSDLSHPSLAAGQGGMHSAKSVSNHSIVTCVSDTVAVRIGRFDVVEMDKMLQYLNTTVVGWIFRNEQA